MQARWHFINIANARGCGRYRVIISQRLTRPPAIYFFEASSAIHCLLICVCVSVLVLVAPIYPLLYCCCCYYPVPVQNRALNEPQTPHHHNTFVSVCLPEIYLFGIKRNNNKFIAQQPYYGHKFL